jgi:hypothetical protein
MKRRAKLRRRYGRARGHSFWRRAPAVDGREIAMRTWWALAAKRAPIPVLQYHDLMRAYRGAPGQYDERQQLLAQIKTTMAKQGIPHPDDDNPQWGSGARRI